MKNKTICLLITLALFLTSCAEQTPAPTTIPTDIYTMVAQTLTALYVPPTETATPQPATATPTVTPTPLITRTSLATTPIATTASVYCDNAKFANDVTIPDNTVMYPGQVFTKTWAIKNVGSCDWTSTYKLKFHDGDKMSGHMQAVGATVVSGDTITISISMVAPSTPGTYTGYWKMINDDLNYFGEMVSVKIIVKE